MGIRETLNQKPAITTAATLVIIVAMLAVIVYQSWDSGDSGTTPPVRAWFTLDDGKNWFADDGSRLSPSEYDGKRVYRVFVFTCDGGKTTFAGFLQRFTPETLKKLADQQSGGVYDSALAALLDGEGVEVKPPLTGDSGWMKRSDPKAAALMEPMCKKTNQPAAAVQP